MKEPSSHIRDGDQPESNAMDINRAVFDTARGALAGHVPFFDHIFWLVVAHSQGDTARGAC